jgi:hypothetical protein
VVLIFLALLCFVIFPLFYPFLNVVVVFNRSVLCSKIKPTSIVPLAWRCCRSNESNNLCDDDETKTRKTVVCSSNLDCQEKDVVAEVLFYVNRFANKFACHWFKKCVGMRLPANMFLFCQSTFTLSNHQEEIQLIIFF